MDRGRLSAFPSLLLHQGVKNKKSSELGQLARETVMPGATKTPESESAPRCGFRPVVTRQAQTVCRWCGTAATESRKAQLPAPRFQAPGSGRGKVGVRAGRGGIGCTMLPSTGQAQECARPRGQGTSVQRECVQLSTSTGICY